MLVFLVTILSRVAAYNVAARYFKEVHRVYVMKVYYLFPALHRLSIALTA